MQSMFCPVCDLYTCYIWSSVRPGEAFSLIHFLPCLWQFTWCHVYDLTGIFLSCTLRSLWTYVTTEHDVLYSFANDFFVTGYRYLFLSHTIICMITMEMIFLTIHFRLRPFLVDIKFMHCLVRTLTLLHTYVLSPEHKMPNHLPNYILLSTLAYFRPHVWSPLAIHVLPCV